MALFCVSLQQINCPSYSDRCFMSRMPHCPDFHAASTKYAMIPSSFFAHASEAGQTNRSSKLPSVQRDHLSRVKMSFASQQAARLAQQRIEKQKEAMAKGTESTSTCTNSSPKVSWMTSSRPSTTSSPRNNHPSASATDSSVPSSSSQGNQDIGQAIKTLRNLEDRLHDFLIVFQIPDHLDFLHLDPPYLYQDAQPLTRLSMTLHNSPVIALGELLKSLEQELGFVEAHGNEYIEVWRNKLANRIKKTTAYLEKEVDDLWWISLESEQA